MNLLSDRVKKIIEEMDGKDHGKQSLLAEIAGVSRAIVNHWTTGVTASMDYRCAKQISEKLGYRVEWLMNGKGLARETSGEARPVAQEQEAQNVSSLAKPSHDLCLAHVTAEEMRLLTFCRTYPEAGKTFHRMAADLTGNPTMK
jgi:hypothetical protein